MKNNSLRQSGTIVCIGFAEALSAPEVVWSLIDNGFRVVAFARKGRRSALWHSRFVHLTEVTAPEMDFKTTLSEIQNLVSTHRRDAENVVLLPLDDTALWICSHLDGQRAMSTTIAAPTGELAELSLNKWRQVQCAREAGLAVPETRLAETAEEALSFGQSLPVILKSVNAVRETGGRLQKGRNWICADNDELQRAVSQASGRFPLLVQPFIKGTGEGVFGLATDDGVLAWSAHRRLRMMNPHGSGSSACASQAVPGPVKECVERFVRQTGWRGIFMIEFLRDERGTCWFVELNGRTWGSTALSRKQGLEYPAWAAQMALHTAPTVPADRDAGVPVVCRNAGREFMHLLFVLRGPQSRAIQGWPRFWKTFSDLLRFGKGQSLYNWRRDDQCVFWSDCWYTIGANVFKARH